MSERCKANEEERRTMQSTISRCSRGKGDGPQGATRPVHDLQGRRDHHGADRGKLVKVAESGQSKLAAAVHDVVIWKRRIEGCGASRVGPHGLHSDPQNIAVFSQELRAFLDEAR